MADAKEVEVANLAKPAEKLAAQYDHESDLTEFDDVPEKAKPVKATEVAASSPPPTPRKHPPSLMRRAMKLGAKKEDIELTSTGDLSDWIEEQEIILDQQRDYAMRSGAVDKFNQAQRAAPVEAAPVKEPDDLEILEQYEKDSQLDPKLANIFKKLIKENREAKEQVGALAKQADDRVVASAEERIDDCFATLPEKYQKLFGSGTLAECTPAERKRRGVAFIGASIDARNPPSPKILAKKLMAEADEVFSVPADEPETNGYEGLTAEKSAKKPNGTVLNGKRPTIQDYEDGVLAKATHRSSKEPKTVKGAKRAVAEKMRELQLTDADFDQYEEDAMPD